MKWEMGVHEVIRRDGQVIKKTSQMGKRTKTQTIKKTVE